MPRDLQRDREIIPASDPTPMWGEPDPGNAPAAHVHPISDVTGLQAELDSKIPDVARSVEFSHLPESVNGAVLGRRASHVATGDLELIPIGVTADTICAGDDPRLGGPGSHTHAVADIEDIPEDHVLGRTSSGTGTGEHIPIGSSAGSVCAGDDSRLSNSRAPNGSAGGDLTGSYPNPTIGARKVLVGHLPESVAAAVLGRRPSHGSSGDLELVPIGTAADTVAAGNDSRFTDSRPPNGTAGGGLTGTYPNPTLANGSVNGAVIVNNGVGLAKIVAIAGDKILGNATGSSGNVTEITCTTFARSILDDADAATVRATIGTDATTASRPPNGSAGGGLTGTYPNPTLANDSVNGAVIVNNGVGLAKIVAIAANKILGNATGSSGNVSEIDCTAAGRALLDDASASAQRTTLGLGDSATRNVGSSAGTVCDGTDTRLSDSRAPNGSAGGDLTGSYPNPTVGARKITAAKMFESTAGAVLGRRASHGSSGDFELVPIGTVADTVCAGDDSRLSNSRAPTGSAGGGLTGSYPNPTLANGSVNGDVIVNNGVGLPKIVAIAANTILGNETGSLGNVTQISCTAAGRALLDDASASDQRTTLGLGGAAVLNVGTTAGTVAAGDDSRLRVRSAGTLSAVPTSTATTIVTLSATNGHYHAVVNMVGAGGGNSYSAIIVVDGSGAGIKPNASWAGSGVSLSMSGLSLQVTHLGGVNYDIRYSVERLDV